MIEFCRGPRLAEFGFVVLGPPVPKQRARLGKGDRFFTPARTASYEKTVRGIGQLTKPRDWPMVADYSVDLFIVFPDARVRDVDNVEKAIADGLIGATWNNDRDIRHVTKRSAIDAVNPRVEVRIVAYAATDTRKRKAAG